MKKRKNIVKSILCIVLAILLATGNSEWAFAENDGKAQDVSEDRENLKIRKTEQQKKEEYLESAGIARNSDGEMISNEYLEFMVNSSGRFTIGNVEGNPDYTSDNNKILLFGHSSPGTSFSTILIQSGRNEVMDFIFKANDNTYDKDGQTVTSLMNAVGSFGSGEAYNFTIIQLLEFVKGSSGIADTVRISYKITNNGSLSQKAGVRIMLDTMLANNDDAPFKVVGYDNVTSELELRESNVPSSYQVYDNLDDPTTIATGTLYLQNDRRPDKVQFARWDYIEDTLYNYAVGGREFGDTAVGIYFDPVVLEASASTSVCIYYGVNSSLSSTDSNVVIENLTDTQFAVLVFDSLSQRYLSGAEVAMEGRTANTDENGIAVFDNCKDIDGKNVAVKVKKERYDEIEVQRQVLCGSFTGIGIVSQGYDLEEPAILSAVLQLGNDMYDLLTTCVLLCQDLVQTKMRYSIS